MNLTASVEFELKESNSIREGSLVYYKIKDEGDDGEYFLEGIDRVLSYDKQQKTYDLEFSSLIAYKAELTPLKIKRIH